MPNGNGGTRHDFDRDRLSRYVQDAEKWLLVIADGLRYPETPAQAAACSMARAAIELMAGVKQQMDIDAPNSGDMPNNRKGV